MFYNHFKSNPIDVCPTHACNTSSLTSFAVAETPSFQPVCITPSTKNPLHFRSFSSSLTMFAVAETPSVLRVFLWKRWSNTYQTTYKLRSFAAVNRVIKVILQAWVGQASMGLLLKCLQNAIFWLCEVYVLRHAGFQLDRCLSHPGLTGSCYPSGIYQQIEGD